MFQWFRNLFIFEKQEEKVLPKEIVLARKFPVLEKYYNKRAPESSKDDEDLYCTSVIAEDGHLKIYRDYQKSGKPVVEIHLDHKVLNMRNCLPEGLYWKTVQKEVTRWLTLHDCEDQKQLSWISTFSKSC